VLSNSAVAWCCSLRRFARGIGGGRGLDVLPGRAVELHVVQCVAHCAWPAADACICPVRCCTAEAGFVGVFAWQGALPSTRVERCHSCGTAGLWPLGGGAHDVRCRPGGGRPITRPVSLRAALLRFWADKHRGQDLTACHGFLQPCTVPLYALAWPGYVQRYRGRESAACFHAPCELMAQHTCMLAAELVRYNIGAASVLHRALHAVETMHNDMQCQPGWRWVSVLFQVCLREQLVRM